MRRAALILGLAFLALSPPSARAAQARPDLVVTGVEISAGSSDALVEEPDGSVTGEVEVQVTTRNRGAVAAAPSFTRVAVAIPPFRLGSSYNVRVPRLAPGRAATRTFTAGDLNRPTLGLLWAYATANVQHSGHLPIGERTRANNTATSVGRVAVVARRWSVTTWSAHEAITPPGSSGTLDITDHANGLAFVFEGAEGDRYRYRVEGAASQDATLTGPGCNVHGSGRAATPFGSDSTFSLGRRLDRYAAFAQVSTSSPFTFAGTCDAQPVSFLPVSFLDLDTATPSSLQAMRPSAARLSGAGKDATGVIGYDWLFKADVP